MNEDATKRLIWPRIEGDALKRMFFSSFFKNLSLSDEEAFLTGLVRTFMETFKMDVGGYLYRHKAEGGAIVCKLIYLEDADGRLAENYPTMREGIEFLVDETPLDYFSKIKELEVATVIDPVQGIGADCWLPLTWEHIIFLDDTTEAVDLGKVTTTLIGLGINLARLFSEFSIYKQRPNNGS
jgi:hypothetical protein